MASSPVGSSKMFNQILSSGYKMANTIIALQNFQDRLLQQRTGLKAVDRSCKKGSNFLLYQSGLLEKWGFCFYQAQNRFEILETASVLIQK